MIGLRRDAFFRRGDFFFGFVLRAAFRAFFMAPS
jgi:hypothetical protein